SLKAYRNGCLYEAMAREGKNLARDWDWFIGWSGDGAGDGKFLEGMMDEIRIYDRPLSEDELFGLYTECGGKSLSADYVDAEICKDEQVSLQGMATGGTPPYSYSWEPWSPDILSSSTESNPTAYPSTTTTYSVVVTDAMGCTTQD